MLMTSHFGNLLKRQKCLSLTPPALAMALEQAVIPLDLAWDILKALRRSTYEKGPDGFPVRAEESGEDTQAYWSRMKEEARIRGGSGYGPARPPGTGYVPGNARHDSANDAAPPPNVDMSTARTLQSPPPTPAPPPGANIGGFTGVKDMSMVTPPSPGQRAENKLNEMRARLPAAPEARTDFGQSRSPAPAPVGPTPANYAHQDSKGEVRVSSPTSTVGSPAAASTTPGSGVGPNSTGATCGGCGMMTGGGACGNTACPTNPNKGLFGMNNQQNNQQPPETNQNPEPGAAAPEQRSMEQRIRDMTATMQKPHTEGMSFGQRVGATATQAVNNLRGADGSLQTGLGLNMQPQGGFGQQYATPDPVNSWWDHKPTQSIPAT